MTGKSCIAALLASPKAAVVSGIKVWASLKCPQHDAVSSYRLEPSNNCVDYTYAQQD
jgi:hypothetical protein